MTRYLVIKDYAGWAPQIVSNLSKGSTRRDALEVACVHARDCREKATFTVVKCLESYESEREDPASYKCDLNASGWQLYSTQAGADDAAKVLSDGFNKYVAAQREIDDGRGDHARAQIVQREMYTLMKKYYDFGAGDTEPECVLCDQLERAFGLETDSVSR